MKNLLTTNNIKARILIKNINNPSWGTFVVDGKYDEGIWNIRGDRGSRVLNESEFKFWELA